MQLRVVRELASLFDTEQLEHCLESEVAGGQNSCLMHDHPFDMETVNALAEAQVVRDYMEQHSVSLNEALRELARRMRHFSEVPQ